MLIKLTNLAQCERKARFEMSMPKTKEQGVSIKLEDTVFDQLDKFRYLSGIITVITNVITLNLQVFIYAKFSASDGPCL
jgi:hypothetical protein